MGINWWGMGTRFARSFLAALGMTGLTSLRSVIMSAAKKLRAQRRT
jgi:hypothetical protein